MIGHTLTEALGILNAALKSANAGHSASVFENVDIVVVFEPNELTLVICKHIEFGFDLIRDVYVFGGLTTEEAGVIHIIDRNYFAGLAELRFIVRNCSGKGGLKDQLRGLNVVTHIVVGSLSDDEIGICGTNYLNKLIVLSFVGRVNEKIAYVAGNNLKAYRFARLLSLADTDTAELVGFDNDVTHIAVGNVTNGNVVSSFLAAKKGSSAADLHIIGMT